MEIVIQGSDIVHKARVSKVQVVIQGSNDCQKARVSRVQEVIQGSKRFSERKSFHGAGSNSGF